MKWHNARRKLPPRTTVLEAHTVLAYSLTHDLVEPAQWDGKKWTVFLTRGISFGAVDKWTEMPGPRTEIA